jgi:hypothetical protein
MENDLAPFLGCFWILEITAKIERKNGCLPGAQKEISVPALRSMIKAHF